MAPANSPEKRARVDTDKESDAIRDADAMDDNRIAQPRGGRRTPASSSRRPLPSALSSQRQLPAFSQTNGTASSSSAGSPTKQQQPPASQSFPPFGYSHGGSASAEEGSTFTVSNPSFNFGAQPSTNPFSTNPTFGGRSEASKQAPVQSTSKNSEQIVTSVAIQFTKESPLELLKRLGIPLAGTVSPALPPPQVSPTTAPLPEVSPPQAPPLQAPTLPAGPTPADLSSGGVSTNPPEGEMDVDPPEEPEMEVTWDPPTSVPDFEMADCDLQEAINTNDGYLPGVPLLNPFQPTLSQSNSTIFPNNGGPIQSQFPFGQPSSSAQPLQNPASPFSFGNVNTPVSTMPQQNTSFATAFGRATQPQMNVNDSANLQQSKPFAPAFGQPSSTAPPQPNFSSDVMMTSPEKNANSPLGKSLFDRVQKTPTDASSSPATTTTAPPPAFSFVQNAFPTAGLQHGSQAPSATDSTVPPPLFPFAQKPLPPMDFRQNPEGPANGIAVENTTSIVPPAGTVLNKTDPFIQGTTPSKSLLGQAQGGEAIPSSDTTQSSSPTKAGRKIAEPKKHIEDKPVQQNPFSNIPAPQKQSSAGPSSTNLSSLAPAKQAGTGSTQISGGILTRANQDGRNSRNPFPDFLQAPNAQKSSNVFSASSAGYGVAKATGENSSTSQSSSSNQTGMFSKSSTGGAAIPQVTQKAQNEGSSSLGESLSAAQSDSSQELKASSKTASDPAHAANKRPQRREPKYKCREPEPPEEWSTYDKQLYILAWKIKELDVGATGKRDSLIAAKEYYKLPLLEEYYDITLKKIWAEYGWMVKVKPAGGISKRATINGPRKRSHDEQNDDALSSADLVPEGHSAHHEPTQTQEVDPGRADKRRRLIEDQQEDQQEGEQQDQQQDQQKDQQVSYPTLSDAAPKSNTSSMFKTILDKPAVASNGDSSTQPATLLSKPLPVSSVLDKSNEGSSEQTLNPFAASIAKWKNGTSTKPSNDESSAKQSATTQSTVFAFKPVTATTSTSISSGNAALKPPTFAQAKSNDFFKQFGQSSMNHAKEEMEKRKAEDMDSDEDEAEWERRDAEQQRAKKQKLERETSMLKHKYIHGQGFAFETAQNDREEPSTTKDAPASDEYEHEIDTQHAEYDERLAAAAIAPNPFAQLAKQDSGNEGSKNGDADDEQDGSDDNDKQTTTAEKPSGGSLFDRITAPPSRTTDDSKNEHPLEASNVGINMFGNISGAAASVGKFSTTNKPATPAKTNIFGNAFSSTPGQNVFGTPTTANANIFGKLPSSTPSQNVFGTPTTANAIKASGSAEQGNNTWNPESPIKFGSSTNASIKKRTRDDDDDTDEGRENAKRADTKEAPAVNVISPSPSKAPTNSVLFGTSLNTSTETPSNKATKPDVGTPTGALGQSFGFGISPLKPGPALGSLFPPSANPSNGVSRSNSPGATTGESATESNAEGDDVAAEKHDQLDLTSIGPGEEGEEILYEVRAKASIWEDKEGEDGEKSGGWVTRGLGPFRILKNKTTSATRMLMRSDPTGRVIINSSLFKHSKYDAPTKSTCRIPIVSAESQNLENWVVKVGKDADAGEMARILEENKE